jgi:uncharacterized protein YecT (DUF1311 family)
MSYYKQLFTLLYFLTFQTVHAQNNYDNWSSACNDAFTTVEMTQCFYKQREIADSLMLDCYSKVMEVLNKDLEKAKLNSEPEFIEWYSDFKIYLVEGQKYWEKMTGSDASFTANLSKGGSMSNMTIHITYTNQTYKRLEVLEGFLEYLTL